jgi:hypothetical protein
MSTRRAVLIVVVALAAVCLPVAVVASGKAGEPAYLKPDSAEFSLNEKWQGARKITGVPQLGLPGVQVAADPAATVWAFSCNPAAQVAVFRRTVQLLGPPSDAEATWSISSEPTTPAWLPLKSLTLSVNGHGVYSRSKPPSGGFSFRLARSSLKVFVAGPNTLEIKATRSALPAGAKRCNVHGQKPYVTLAGKFHFFFATDLRVGVPKDAVGARKGTSILVEQFIKNEGPDAALNVELMVDYGGSNSTFTVLGGKTGTTCGTGGTIRRCPIGRLEPGQSYHVLVRVEWTPPDGTPNWDHNSGAVSFIVLSKTPDSNAGNDRVNINFLMCQDTSTLEQCKNAS